MPKKVPNPNPTLFLNDFDLDLIYGSPKAVIISSGKPGPSSSMITNTFILSLSIEISIFWLENFTAFPKKFLNPYTISGFF